MNNCTLSNAIIACLSYFDIFQHPLKMQEIENFLSIPVATTDLENELSLLVKSNKIFKSKTYYSLNDTVKKVADRIDFEKRADEKMEDALHYGKLIQGFPFTKGVCISGSLSKHIMKADSDIDFFIISKPNRIWISKLMLKLYKFMFLKNSRSVFCINYFIAENNLYIDEQNTYTATELVTLIPLGCQKEYSALMQTNDWYKKLLPNFDFASKKSLLIEESVKPIASRIVESLFIGKWGNFVDSAIMKFNQKRNKKKYSKLKKNKDFELMLRATKNQIKVHDSNHQNVTLAKYEKLISKLDNNY